MTEQQIAKHVTDSFDSVNLIIELNAKEVLTDGEIETKSRNKEHLSGMLSKEWFLNALTPEQLIQIQAVIL